MNPESLKTFLDEKHDRYNSPDFIWDDPVSIPHAFSEKEDIEISAFLVALFSWGKRSTIVKNGEALMDLMDRQPFAFVSGASEAELQRLSAFVHRTFNGTDCIALVRSLREVYSGKGGLEAIFMRPKGTQDYVFQAIVQARSHLLERKGFPDRSRKHVANPASGSSAKRINMFLRWMVRQDARGVDFGLWKDIPVSALRMPLDVHTGTVARKLGLLGRKQNDWNAVEELTANLRKMDPEDPVRYDYSLFGLGINEKF